MAEAEVCCVESIGQMFIETNPAEALRVFAGSTRRSVRTESPAADVKSELAPYRTTPLPSPVHSMPVERLTPAREISGSLGGEGAQRRSALPCPPVAAL